MGSNLQYVMNLSQVYNTDIGLVGKKAHALGILWRLGIPLPSGFVITTDFFKEFLCLTGIDTEIKRVQALSHPSISGSIEKLFQPIQKQIIHHGIPQSLAIELHKFYRKLSGTLKVKSLNVFSSSFNNRSVVFSDIKGDANLILKIKTIWARTFKGPVAIVVQENIKSETKGKIFTDNPIFDKKLTQLQMNKLAGYCNAIRKHFYFPYEIEYAVKNDKIFITKLNPFTGSVDQIVKPAPSDKKKKVLVKGISIVPGIVTGPVRVLHNKYKNSEVKRGEILVLHSLDASLFERIKNAKAVIVDSILQNSLDKTLYRKNFYVPTIEGAKTATKMFQNGNVVTVNAVTGEIYSGGIVY